MNEAQTRLNKIDPKLRDAGWGIVPGSHYESQGQILDSLKESPIQKECDALKQVILSNRKNTTYAVAYK